MKVFLDISYELEKYESVTAQEYMKNKLNIQKFKRIVHLPKIEAAQKALRRKMNA